MKTRTDYFGAHPVRYLIDADGLEYVCVNDLRDACNPLELVEPVSHSIN